MRPRCLDRRDTTKAFINSQFVAQAKCLEVSQGKLSSITVQCISFFMSMSSLEKRKKVMPYLLVLPFIKNCSPDPMIAWFQEVFS